MTIEEIDDLFVWEKRSPYIGGLRGGGVFVSKKSLPLMVNQRASIVIIDLQHLRFHVIAGRDGR